MNLVAHFVKLYITNDVNDKYGSAYSKKSQIGTFMRNTFTNLKYFLAVSRDSKQDYPRAGSKHMHYSDAPIQVIG